MRIADTRRPLAIVVLPVLAVLFGLLVLPPLVDTGSSQPLAATSPAPPVNNSYVPPPPPENLCGRKALVHYYTYDKPKESEHAFGPTADPGPSSTSREFNIAQEFWRRLCGDPEGSRLGGDWALLRAIQGMVDGTNPNRPLTADEWQVEVRDMENRIDWESWQVVNEDTHHGSLFTLYMTVKSSHDWTFADEQPTIHVQWEDAQEASTFMYIDVHKKDGGIVRLKLRVNCGYQPTYYNSHETPEGLT